MAWRVVLKSTGLDLSSSFLPACSSRPLYLGDAVADVVTIISLPVVPLLISMGKSRRSSPLLVLTPPPLLLLPLAADRK
jgi:hypothetical protein